MWCLLECLTVINLRLFLLVRRSFPTEAESGHNQSYYLKMTSNAIFGAHIYSLRLLFNLCTVQFG